MGKENISARLILKENEGILYLLECTPHSSFWPLEGDLVGLSPYTVGHWPIHIQHFNSVSIFMIQRSQKIPPLA